MSDTPQGDGWWQTSDGKWHPPEYDPTVAQDPSAAPETPPPPPAPPAQGDVPPPWSPSGTQGTGDAAPGATGATAEWGDQWVPQETPGTPPPDGSPAAPLFGEPTVAESPQFSTEFDPNSVAGSDPETSQEPAGATTNRPGEFGLPSETPRTNEPKVVRAAPVIDSSGGSGESAGGMSPVIKWSAVAVVVLLALVAGWYFLIRDSGDDTASTAESPDASVAGDTTVATGADESGSEDPTETTAPLPPKPTIAAGERLPVLEFNGTGSSVVAIDPAGPRVAKVEYTGSGPFSVTGKDANDSDVETYVSSDGPYSGSVAVDFHDEQDSRSLAIEGDGPWTITMVPVESLDAIPGAFTGSGDNVVLYSGEVGPVNITHSGTSTFKVNTFEIKTRDIATIVDETGPFDGSVELRGPAFVWIEADGDWSVTPG